MAAILIEIMGWVGAFLMLLAYFLLTHHDLTSKSRIYHWMNLLGGLMLGTHAFIKSAYPSFVTNAFWILVAFYGLYKAFKR